MAEIHWYLVHTKPRQENTAVENLKRQDYTCYLPTVKRRRRSQMRWVQQIEPLFPRYLFIQLDQDNDNWAPIRSTRGVAQLVRFGGMPAKLPQTLIDCLSQQEQQQADDLPVFKPGESVRVLDGVMQGYQGIFDSHCGQARVHILLDIAGRHTRLQLPADAIDHTSP